MAEVAAAGPAADSFTGTSRKISLLLLPASRRELCGEGGEKIVATFFSAATHFFELIFASGQDSAHGFGVDPTNSAKIPDSL